MKVYKILVSETPVNCLNCLFVKQKIDRDGLKIVSRCRVTKHIINTETGLTVDCPLEAIKQAYEFGYWGIDETGHAAQYSKNNVKIIP